MTTAARPITDIDAELTAVTTLRSALRAHPDRNASTITKLNATITQLIDERLTAANTAASEPI